MPTGRGRGHFVGNQDNPGSDTLVRSQNDSNKPNSATNSPPLSPISGISSNPSAATLPTSHGSASTNPSNYTLPPSGSGKNSPCTASLLNCSNAVHFNALVEPSEMPCVDLTIERPSFTAQLGKLRETLVEKLAVEKDALSVVSNTDANNNPPPNPRKPTGNKRPNPVWKVRPKREPAGNSETGTQ